nr:hypothetical protein TnSNPV_110 [Trichoplusia ni single nucleopolyhedrovirus]
MHSSSTILIEYGEKSCWMLIDTKKRKIDSVDCVNGNIVYDNNVQDKINVVDGNNHNIIVNDDDVNTYCKFIKRKKIK